MVAHSRRFSVAQTLHTQLLDAVRTTRLADAAVAKLLLQVKADKLYTELGYASLNDYADRALDLRPSKTRALVRIAAKLDHLPVLAEAVNSGVLSWTKAREVVRIAISSTEADWVAHAQTATNRELETLAAVGLPGDNVADAAAKKKDRPDLRTLVFKNVPADLAALIEDALAFLIQQAANGGDPSYLAADRAEALAVMAQRILFEATGEDAPSAERFRIVLNECPTCAAVSTETGNIDETHAEMAKCCGDVVDLRVSADTEDAESPDESDEQPQANRTRGTRRSTIPPRIRRAVLHRDGRTCVVKDCTNRLWIDLHHVTPHALADVALRRFDGPHRPQPLGQATLQFPLTRVRIVSLAHIAHSLSTTILLELEAGIRQRNERPNSPQFTSSNAQPPLSTSAPPQPTPPRHAPP